MEKSILAYFNSPVEASGVLAKLQALRAAEARIDQAPAMIAGDITGLSGLIEGDGGAVNEQGILLTARVDESIHHKAVRLINEAGGIL